MGKLIVWPMWSAVRSATIMPVACDRTRQSCQRRHAEGWSRQGSPRKHPPGISRLGGCLRGMTLFTSFRWEILHVDHNRFVIVVVVHDLTARRRIPFFVMVLADTVCN